MTLWITARQAREIGCTHYAWHTGLIPGFLNPTTGDWASRSDLLNPIEDALCWLWVNSLLLCGRAPHFRFVLGREIEP